MKDIINAEMSIGEVVRKYPQAMEVFMKNGMHCVGCAAAHFENIAQGCEAHGIDTKKLIKELNEAVKN